MVLRVFAGICVLYSLPPRVYHMIQICRRRAVVLCLRHMFQGQKRGWQTKEIRAKRRKRQDSLFLTHRLGCRKVFMYAIDIFCIR
jgi:hypothetical protein